MNNNNNNDYNRNNKKQTTTTLILSTETEKWKATIAATIINRKQDR